MAYKKLQNVINENIYAKKTQNFEINFFWIKWITRIIDLYLRKHFTAH